ncbi:MAG: divergent PAP2 family protein [Eubacterium sp.]|jgi:acid phosphatase family membrane protein YuiD|nr:divergent PAP2 family protein [Eubacterium sp.]
MVDLYNPTLIAALIGWAIAQSTKIILNAIKYKRFIPERIFGAGGMPSSHASTVCALATVVCRICGPASVEFALAVTLALVVMYDAAGVRRAAGMHAQELNKMKQIVYEFEQRESPEDQDFKEIMEIHTLKEYLGHTPIEVICGAVLGIFIGLAIGI